MNINPKQIVKLGQCILIAIFFAVTVVHAADDPGIKGAIRQNISQSMGDYIRANTINGSYYMYDAIEGRMLNLKLDALHEGIVKKGEFYVSCADFFDANGRKVDLDFLVIPDGEHMVTTQAVVHAVDGKKRKYHLE
jgi:hypothetical protein